MAGRREASRAAQSAHLSQRALFFSMAVVRNAYDEVGVTGRTDRTAVMAQISAGSHMEKQ
jgi:hypothetical protein